MGQHCQCKFLLPSITTTPTTLSPSSTSSQSSRRRRRRRGFRIFRNRVQTHIVNDSHQNTAGELLLEEENHTMSQSQSNNNNNDNAEEEEEEEYFSSQEHQEQEEESNQERENEQQQQHHHQLQVLQNQLPHNIQAVIDPNDGTLTFFAPPPQSSSSSSSSSSEEGGEEEEELPAARHHAYLPGISHPLYPEDWIHSSTTASARDVQPITTNNNNNDMEDDNNYNNINEQIPPIPPPPPHTNSNPQQQLLLELPILQLTSIILFPNSTIPLRLRNPDWISYLGRQIQHAKYSQKKVQIGIATEVSSGVRRRRRIPDVGSRAVGRWRTELIRRGGGGGTRRRRVVENQEGQEGEEQQLPQEEEGAAAVVVPPAVVQPPPPIEPEVVPSDPLIGRIGTIATITYTHEEEEEDDDDHNRRQGRRRRNDNLLIVTAVGTGRFRIQSRIDQDDENNHNNNNNNRRTVGGYGDMADIRLYIVQDLQNESCIPLPPPSFFKQRQSSSLVQGTNNKNKNKRGRNVHEDILQNLSLCTGMPSFVYRQAWPWFLVEEIRGILCSEVEWEGLNKSLPFCYGGGGGGDGDDDGSGNAFEEEEDGENVIATAATVSNTPKESTATISATTDNNHKTTTTTKTTIDPAAFSYWLSSNMPLSEQDRLELLETNCTVKRLQFILQKMKKAKQANKTISCKHCGVEISRVCQMFTVGGAEGTTGAYVNEHGVIHQTLTLREVNMNSVICIGRAETRDSWFPGYSWTITNCSICHSHLGWKFLSVKKRHHHHHHHHRALNNNRHNSSSTTATSTEESEENEEDCDRPSMFWGLSNASVTTDSTSPQRVRHGRFQLQDWLFAPPAHSESEEEF